MPPRGRGFYLNLLRPRKGGIYARLCRSHWDQGKVRTEVLVNFGRVTPQQATALRGWVETNPLAPGPAGKDALLLQLRDLRCTRTWRYGREALAHFLWWKLGLHQIVLETLNGVPGKARCGRWIETLVVNRLADPTSKYGILHWLEDSATPFLLGFGVMKRHENAMYRAMDRLWVRQEALERRVWERVVRPLSEEKEVFLHDLSSSYYEGRVGGLVQYGYHRDRVEGCPQVNFGMVVTPDRLPITIMVYPGNPSDVSTVAGVRERLRRVFGLQRGIYVGDRGMRSPEVEQDLVAHGFRWIFAEKNGDVEAVLEAAAKRPPLSVGEKLVAREVTGEEGRRHVALFNEARREEVLATLERRLAQGQSILERIRRGWAKNPKRPPHAVMKQAILELAEKGLTGLFDIDVDEDSIRVLLARTKEKVCRLRRWAGWWVLTTNTELPVEEVIRLYLSLSTIERDWRELKSALEVRPLRHQLDRRIGAHLVICELALLLEKYVEKMVRAEGLTEEGVPLTGARAVEKFRSLVVNRQELPGAGVQFHQATEPDGEQAAILRAVGLKLEQFRRGWTRIDPAGMAP